MALSGGNRHLRKPSAKGLEYLNWDLELGCTFHALGSCEELPLQVQADVSVVHSVWLMGAVELQDRQNTEAL